MGARIREITPEDRLFHELVVIKRRLDQLLAEYEVSRAVGCEPVDIERFDFKTLLPTNRPARTLPREKFRRAK